MSEQRTRQMLAACVMIALIPLEILSLWTRDELSPLDWWIAGLIAMLCWTSIGEPPVK